MRSLANYHSALAPAPLKIALSRNERFVFATNETTGTVSVIDVAKALASGFGASAVIGEIPVETCSRLRHNFATLRRHLTNRSGTDKPVN